MFLKAWYFITLILVALLLGTTFGHALEMPPKMKFDGALWMTLEHRLYLYFLYIGGPIELGAIISAAVLSYLVRNHPSSFYLTLSGTALLVVAFFAVWLTLTRSANAEIATWTAASIPQDWTRWRTQWEYSHLTRFVLQMIAFGALVLSVLVEPLRLGVVSTTLCASASSMAPEDGAS